MGPNFHIVLMELLTCICHFQFHPRQGYRRHSHLLSSEPYPRKSFGEGRSLSVTHIRTCIGLFVEPRCVRGKLPHGPSVSVGKAWSEGIENRYLAKVWSLFGLPEQDCQLARGPSRDYGEETWRDLASIRRLQKSILVARAFERFATMTDRYRPGCWI